VKVHPVFRQSLGVPDGRRRSVLEEDLSDEEADSAGPSKVGGAGVGGTGERQGRV
jgi:hypothetical protein